MTWKTIFSAEEESEEVKERKKKAEEKWKGKLIVLDEEALRMEELGSNWRRYFPDPLLNSALNIFTRVGRLREVAEFLVGPQEFIRH